MTTHRCPSWCQKREGYEVTIIGTSGDGSLPQPVETALLTGAAESIWAGSMAVVTIQLEVSDRLKKTMEQHGVCPLESVFITDSDIRHIMLVADIITNIGYMKAIGRFGISGKKSSVLAKASFEITTKNLMIAAMSGVVDDIAGVAESIIVGQPVALGTGAVNIIYKPKENTQKGDEE